MDDHDALIRGGRAAQGEGAAPATAAVLPCQRGKAWLEVLIVDAANRPVAGVTCSVTLADGRELRLTTGDDGVCSLADIDPGTCKIGLPDFDRSGWGPGRPG